MLLKDYDGFQSIEVQLNTDKYQIIGKISELNTIESDWFKVKESGNGIGTKLINNQIFAAKKHGFSDSTLFANRYDADEENPDEKQNGYYKLVKVSIF